MFWQTLNSTKDYYDCFSIQSVSVDQKKQQSALHGQMHVILTLSNGKNVSHTFERDAWEKFQQSYLKGGFVINA